MNNETINVTAENHQEPETNWKDQMEFDFRAITARTISQLDKALKTVDIDAGAAIYARVITKCPPEWGDPKDPETYARLPFFGEYSELVGAMGDAAKNAKKR